MNKKNVILQINRLLKQNADDDYLKKLKIFVPSEKLIIGVRVPKIKELAAHYNRIEKLEIQEIVLILDELFIRQIRDEILFGIFLLKKYDKLLTSKYFEKVDLWVNQIENWEVCDQLASNIAASLVSRDLELVAKLIAWTKSPNMWRRRFVLAVGSCLNQRGRSHIDETLMLCEKLIHDKEKMVEKALAWALKETAKKDAVKVFKFLTTNKSEISKRVMKEVVTKLPESMKSQLL